MTSFGACRNNSILKLDILALGIGPGSDKTQMVVPAGPPVTRTGEERPLLPVDRWVVFDLGPRAH